VLAVCRTTGWQKYVVEIVVISLLSARLYHKVSNVYHVTNLATHFCLLVTLQHLYTTQNHISITEWVSNCVPAPTNNIPRSLSPPISDTPPLVYA